MPKLIMLIGLPGSGKSSYAQLLRTQDSFDYFSSDKIREELYGDESIQGDANKVFRIMHHRVKDALLKGHNVIYDATNVTRKNRRSVIQEIKSICKDIEAHVVWATYEECVDRDKQRSRCVGEDVIRKFLYRWESPNYDEGFSKVHIIDNTSQKFDRTEYTTKLLESTKISHDNPHHRLSVSDHCAAAEEYMINKYPTASYRKSILTAAACYHDIGKPVTKFFKENETIAHYYCHDNVGGYLVYGCYNLTAPESIKQAIEVSWLVSNHMQPYFQSNYYKNLPSKLRELIDEIHEADLYAH